MESDSLAFCYLGMDRNTWTLEVTAVSIEGDDPELLEVEKDRWAEAGRLDFDPDDPSRAWIDQVLFESEFGETLERIQLVQSDTSTQE